MVPNQISDKVIICVVASQCFLFYFSNGDENIIFCAFGNSTISKGFMKIEAKHDKFTYNIVTNFLSLLHNYSITKANVLS